MPTSRLVADLGGQEIAIQAARNFRALRKARRDGSQDGARSKTVPPPETKPVARRLIAPSVSAGTGRANPRADAWGDKPSCASRSGFHPTSVGRRPHGDRLVASGRLPIALLLLSSLIARARM